MRRVVSSLMILFLTLHSGDGWSQQKQGTWKDNWSKERVALVAVSVLAVVGGASFVRAVRKNKFLADVLADAQKANKKTQGQIDSIQQSFDASKELYTKRGEEIHDLQRQLQAKDEAWQETVLDVERQSTRVDELEVQRIELIRQIEEAKDAKEESIGKLLNGFSSGNNIEYSDSFREQIRAILKGLTPWDSTQVYSYLKSGNLQEIVWKLRSIGKAKKADRLEELLASVLKEGEIVRVERASGGRTGALILTFKNGMRGVFKHRAEVWEGVAMHRLDKLLGSDSFPITVVREVELRKGSIDLVGDLDLHDPVVRLKGSVQLLIENGIEMAVADEIYGGAAAVINSMGIPRRIRTLALIANDGDMGSHNVLLPARGRMLAIDGGQGFGVYRYGGDITDWSNFIHKHYTHPDFINRLQNIDDADLEHVVEPLFNFFHKEELEIFKRFDESIASVSSRDELEAVMATDTLLPMADQLRALYKKENAVAKIENILISRTNHYRERLQVVGFLRKSIDDYIETAQKSWQH